MSTNVWNAPAPGELELVRRFLNTWEIPSETRTPEDRLPALLRDRGAWEERFPEAPPGPQDTEKRLLELRDDLRGILDGGGGWTDRLNRWLEVLQLVTWVEQEDGGKASLHYWPRSMSGFVDQILLTVVLSIEDGTWFRLKACPDCRYVFYDRSRSKTRVWCGMLAGEGGRACGTIAKVRRYRERQRRGGGA